MTTSTGFETDHRVAARGLLLAAWLLAPAWCVLKAMNLLVHFLGESATPAEELQAATWLVRAAVLAVVLPLAALLLRGGRRWWLALAISAGFSLFAWDSAQSLRPAPEPAPRPYVCQERSGGDTDCPGG
jgi:hypothetical protein